MIVYGHRLYGYCDAVPGQFHVATQFVHIWFVPLVPLGSYVVLEGHSEGNSWRGVKIGFNLKSLLFAWARAGLILSTLGGLVGGVMLLADAEVLGGLASLIVAVLCGVAVFASYRLLGNASPARTQELFAKLGVSSPIGAGAQATDPQLPAPPANPWPPQQGAQQPWPPQQGAQQPWPPQQAAQQPWPPQQASQQAAQQAWPPQQASQQPWQQQQASPQPWPPQQSQQPWPPQQSQQPWPPQQSQQPWPPQQAAQQPWPPQKASQQPWPPQQAGQPQASAPQPYPPGDWPRR